MENVLNRVLLMVNPSPNVEMMENVLNRVLLKVNPSPNVEMIENVGTLIR